MARLLDELGHEVIERDPRYGSAALEFTQTYLRAIHEALTELPDPSLAERSTRQMAAAGGALVPAFRRDALRRRRPATTARIGSLWDEVDVLLTPGLARTAMPAEGGHGRPAAIAFQMAASFTPWTPIFNLTGQPAITIPAGIGADGLPLRAARRASRRRGRALLARVADRVRAALGPAAPAGCLTCTRQDSCGLRPARSAR